MSIKQLTDSSRPHLARGDACVLVAACSADASERACLESLLEHTPADVAIVAVAADAAVREQLLSWQPAGAGDRTEGGQPSLWVAGAGPSAYDDRALTAAVDHTLAALSP